MASPISGKQSLMRRSLTYHVALGKPQRRGGRPRRFRKSHELRLLRKMVERHQTNMRIAEFSANAVEIRPWPLLAGGDRIGSRFGQRACNDIRGRSGHDGDHGSDRCGNRNCGERLQHDSPLFGLSPAPFGVPVTITLGRGPSRCCDRGHRTALFCRHPDRGSQQPGKRFEAGKRRSCGAS